MTGRKRIEMRGYIFNMFDYFTFKTEYMYWKYVKNIFILLKAVFMNFLYRLLNLMQRHEK